MIYGEYIGLPQTHERHTPQTTKDQRCYSYLSLLSETINPFGFTFSLSNSISSSSNSVRNYACWLRASESRFYSDVTAFLNSLFELKMKLIDFHHIPTKLA